jgi:hypothetical protein
MKFMRIFSALALAMTLAGPAAARQNQQPKPDAGSPKMVIESFTHDFGEVKSGTPLRYTFKIKNEGKADLSIMNVAPS